MATAGNAVVAEWQGPTGFQLFDGTVLNPGVVISGVGLEEATDNPYWNVLGDVDTYKGEASADASAGRDDWSFGSEEGGEGTGRPLAEDHTSSQQVPLPKAQPTPQIPPVTPDPVEGEAS